MHWEISVLFIFHINRYVLRQKKTHYIVFQQLLFLLKQQLYFFKTMGTKNVRAPLMSLDLRELVSILRGGKNGVAQKHLWQLGK